MHSGIVVPTNIRSMLSRYSLINFAELPDSEPSNLMAQAISNRFSNSANSFLVHSPS